MVLLVVGVTLPALASITSGSSPRNSSASAAAGPTDATVAARAAENQPPADRGDRPSPYPPFLSSGEALAAHSQFGDAAGPASAGLTPSASGLTPSALAQLLPSSPRPIPRGSTATPQAAIAKSSVPPAAPKIAKPAAPAPYRPVAAGYPFSSISVWRQSVAGVPVAANSSVLVDSLTSTIKPYYDGVAAFNVDSYNTAYYTVGPGTPKTDVKFDNCQSKWGEPDGLAEQFSQVPIPSDAVPAAGTDAELTIYSPSTDQLWEFWVTSHRADGWYACWGGRIDHVSTSPGYFTGGFGATATGLPVAGGMISIADAKAGVINHAMSLEILNPAPWDNFSYPAQRSDGGDNSPSAIPEGTRFRLDPSINVNALDLTPLAKMVAKAAQQYGFIVTDQSGAVAVQAENAASAGSDPWPGLMRGVPSYEILANFPWSQLQVLPKNWGQ